MAEDRSPDGTDRREFLDWLMGVSAAGLGLAVLYPVARYVVPPEAGESAASSITLDIGPDDLGANTGRIFKFGNSAGILVKTASGDLRAFSGTCTHLGCIVQYRPDLAHIWCACHNGHFDLNGTNIQGPPPSPLERYDVNVRGDKIVVSRRA
jgi:Rieske Fe-S protein